MELVQSYTEAELTYEVDIILFFSFSKHQTQNTEKISDLPNVTDRVSDAM